MIPTLVDNAHKHDRLEAQTYSGNDPKGRFWVHGRCMGDILAQYQGLGSAMPTGQTPFD